MGKVKEVEVIAVGIHGFEPLLEVLDVGIIRVKAFSDFVKEPSPTLSQYSLDLLSPNQEPNYLKVDHGSGGSFT